MQSKIRKTIRRILDWGNFLLRVSLVLPVILLILLISLIVHLVYRKTEEVEE